MVKISEILSTQSILLNSELDSKDEILKKIVELACNSGNIEDPKAVYNSVLERENIMSTGIGNNIAIPHTKSSGIKELTAALITFEKPVNFDSLDGKKISVAFLILSNDEELGMHIKILSKISRILHNRSFFDELLTLNKNTEVIELFDNFEN
jgi:fructose-specific phosphotransferase system IIA component